MNQFYLKIKKIQTLKELEKESEVQKREHADLHTDEVLAGIIDDALKEINWIAAKNSDYDYIPWAENRNYPQLWKDNYYQPQFAPTKRRSKDTRLYKKIKPDKKTALQATKNA